MNKIQESRFNIIEDNDDLKKIKEDNCILKAIINSIQDAVSVVNKEGKIVIVNKAYTKIIGLSKEEVINKPAEIDIKKGKSVHRSVLKTGEKVLNQHLKVGKNGDEVVISGAPIIINGELWGSMAISRDISEIRKITKRLKYMEKKIEKLESKYNFDSILGKSSSIELAKQLARNVASTDATVFLRGKSGVGKELFAYAIHESSPRKDKKFIRVNCSALTDSLVNSELFGYEGGSFTGSKEGGKKGLFEEAEGGTIFLDEIGELDLSHQSMLLRALNEKEIIRVGGSKTILIDVRIISATNLNLEEAIRNGNFREDLYFRLMVYPIYIPSLKERKEDIPILTDFIIKKFNGKYGRSVKKISSGALKRLKEYSWPGNVRELENIIGRAMINMNFKETIIEEKHIDFINIERKTEENQIIEKSLISGEKSLKEIVSQAEKMAIENALKKTHGNRHKAAEILDISTRTIYYKIKEYQIS